MYDCLKGIITKKGSIICAVVRRRMWLTVTVTGFVYTSNIIEQYKHLINRQILATVQWKWPDLMSFHSLSREHSFTLLGEMAKKNLTTNRPRPYILCYVDYIFYGRNVFRVIMIADKCIREKKYHHKTPQKMHTGHLRLTREREKRGNSHSHFLPTNR